jgi:hypothetical protein
MSNNALPTDYVRPTLAEFLAASKAHTAAEHLPWCERYEAGLRRHFVPPALEPEPELEPADEIMILDELPSEPADPSAPWEYVRDARGIITGTRPIAAPASPELPAGYKRPTLEQFTAAGYPAERYEAFFENHESRLRRGETTPGEEPAPAGVQPSDTEENGPAESATGAPPPAV